MTTPSDTQPGRGQRPPAPPTDEPPATKPHQRPEVPAVEVSGRVGGDVVAGDYEKNVRAGRDVVGRDVVTTTTTTNVGFSATAVQRLLITVGAMVFVTAACFFSGGVVVGGTALAALDKQVASDDPTAAAEFAELLQILRALPPGQGVQFTFTEQQLSAYFRQQVAPTLPLDITEAKVRLLDSGDLAIGGRAGALGGARFATTFAWEAGVGGPLRLQAAAVEVLPLNNRVFGWVAVPTGLLRPLTDGLNDLFGDVRITSVTPEGEVEDTWTATAISQ